MQIAVIISAVLVLVISLADRIYMARENEQLHKQIELLKRLKRIESENTHKN